MAASFTVTTAMRLAVGALLLSAAGALAVGCGHLELGLAWLALIPALALAVPAMALLQRRRLAISDGRLTVETGWIWRRDLEIALADARLAVIPTAGLRTVILQRGGHEHLLAAWLTAARAEALCSWMQAAAGTPRSDPPPPARDR